MPNILFPGDEMDKIRMSEAQYSKMILDQLEPYFLIDEQVTGIGPHGERVRIDAVITPIDLDLWAKKDVKFGIEFKISKESQGALKRSIEQCERYKFSKFYDGKHHLDLILLCPGEIEKWGIRKESEYDVFRLIDALSIGMIKGSGDSLRIMCNRDHCQWSKKNGVEEGKINTYKRN